MTPDQILEIDAKRNYPKGTSVGNLRAAINAQLRQKGQIVQQGKTLIVFSNADEDDDVEYHCFNADTPENLAANVMKFFEMAKQIGYATATTSYQNPKISELFTTLGSPKYEIDIKKTSTGFEAKARL
jgi:hypothetical protein